MIRKENLFQIVLTPRGLRKNCRADCWFFVIVFYIGLFLCVLVTVTDMILRAAYCSLFFVIILRLNEINLQTKTYLVLKKG